MITDALVNLVSPGAPLSLVSGAGIAIPSSVYDILGTGVGTAPQAIIGTRTLFGSDMGVGVKKPLLVVSIGAALVTGNAATLNVQFQGAVDTGAGGGYQPGTWRTFEETGPLAVADCTAGTLVARFDWPPAWPFNVEPRYLRLNFAPPAATNFSAGAIAFATVTMDRDDYSIKYAAKNFVVA